jgi:hypothetical protein
MSLYIIAIGGTGAKCAEALTFLASAGLFNDEKIRVLFIDPDESNGNLTRTRELIGLYQRCYNLPWGNEKRRLWMQANVSHLPIWSPFGNQLNKTLGDYFSYNSYRNNNASLGHLFDVLYTKEEREAVLDVGFRGRPAIGSAVMSQLDLDNLTEEPWGTFFNQIEADIGVGQTPVMFMFGSAFGGTGASGFPTIGRLIAERLKQSDKRSRVRLGGALMLPYFQFTVPAGHDGIFARPEQFLLSTEAALRYYRTQARETFDAIYLLGDQDPSLVREFSIGKNTQQNDPHLVEVYAALAARQFLLDPPTNPVVLTRREDVTQVTWNDVPEATTIRGPLEQTTKFTYTWVCVIAEDLDIFRTDGINAVPWAKHFYRSGMFPNRSLPEFDAQQQSTVKLICDWSERYLAWLGVLHRSAGGLKLFNPDAFTNSEGQVKKNRDAIPRLMLSTTSSQTDWTTLTNRLDRNLVEPPNEGTIGLAKSLYSLSI